MTESSEPEEHYASGAAKWKTLRNGQRVEIGLVQVDIEGHSKIKASDQTLKEVKIVFYREMQRIASSHGGELFDWAGDGGSFMFLTGEGEGFNELVSAALEMLDHIPAVNKRIANTTDLRTPISVRISCDAGIVVFDHTPSHIVGEFLNVFLKNEKAISIAGAVCITERVWKQLRWELRDCFESSSYSSELLIHIYRLRVERQFNGTSLRQQVPTQRAHSGRTGRVAALPLSIFFLAPLLVTTIAIVLQVKWNIALVLILATATINCLIGWIKSFHDSTQGQSFIHSLWFDDLLPNESGRPLLFQARIVIIEDEAQKGQFLRSLERQFASKNEPNERNLILVPFSCGSSNSEIQRQKLRSKLKGVNAVVLVRTKGLEEKAWIYEFIDSWAYTRSDVPILFTEMAESERKNPIPDKYFSVPPDARSLPWRLLQRANERGFDWRGVAGFNRSIVASSITLLLMSVLVCSVVVSRDTRQNKQTISDLAQARQRIVGEMFQSAAIDLKNDYLNKATIKDQGSAETPLLGTSDVDISFWFSSRGKVRQFAATESRSNYRSWDFNKGTAIGCAFMFGNHLTEANINNKDKNTGIVPIRMWDAHDKEIPDPEAKMYEEPRRTITSIVCVTNNGTPSVDPKYTVGICAFTTKGKDISVGNYRELLRKKVEELYERAKVHIEKDELTALPE